MNSLNVVFAVHNHQPSGNFPSVLEDAYRLAYLPFLQVMDRHPAVAFTQHWTGTLLEWLVRHHPECVELMRAMVQRGQLELLSGGFYEPIFPVIPEVDRIGQIRKLNVLLESTFGCSPRGTWLAERVWEPHVASSLAQAGMEFVVVDDTHFRHAGLEDHQLYGYYVTEELGEKLKVFPIDKTLRYTVPFRPEGETLEYVRRAATPDGMRVCVHADDGEKFGVWPKTYRHVYEEGWLERFCAMLELHSDCVRTTHFGAVLDSQAPTGRVYLPTATYAEMTKWVLSPSVALRLDAFETFLKTQGQYEENGMFVRGGFWRNFFAKYPEANHMHKKMLRVSRKVHESIDAGSTPPAALDDLWAGQCNDPYWHGLFGGLYLPNLRFPVYRSLLKAEAATDAAKGGHSLRVETVDFDCDGMDELLIESEVIDLCFKPDAGGCLVELSFKAGGVNLLDILSRREEASHRRLLEAIHSKDHGKGWDELLAKEADLDKHIFFDWYRHASLLDHFLDAESDLESFARCQHKELGDFVNQPYGSTLAHLRNQVAVVLVREGAIWRDGKPHRVSVRKTIGINLEKVGYSVEYTIGNLEKVPISVRFGIEFAHGGMAGDADDRYFSIGQEEIGPTDPTVSLTSLAGETHGRAGVVMRKPANPRLRSQGEESGVISCRATDEWMRVTSDWILSKPATLWRYPLETVSLSESGFERLYQGSILLPLWTLNLAPAGAEGSRWDVSIRQELNHW